MPSEVQVKNFLFRRKVMFRSQDNQVFFVFKQLIIYQIYDVMMSIRQGVSLIKSFEQQLIKLPHLANR